MDFAIGVWIVFVAVAVGEGGCGGDAEGQEDGGQGICGFGYHAEACAVHPGEDAWGVGWVLEEYVGWCDGNAVEIVVFVEVDVEGCADGFAEARDWWLLGVEEVVSLDGDLLEG